MRFATKSIVLAAALAPAACASAQNEPIAVYGSVPLPPSFRLVETTAVPPPVNDISEAQRREWLAANQTQETYRPSNEMLEYEPSCGSHCHGGFFGLPISIGLGWYGGDCHGGGFGVGVGVCGIGVGVGIGGW